MNWKPAVTTVLCPLLPCYRICTSVQVCKAGRAEKGGAMCGCPHTYSPGPGGERTREAHMHAANKKHWDKVDRRRAQKSFPNIHTFFLEATPAITTLYPYHILCTMHPTNKLRLAHHHMQASRARDYSERRKGSEVYRMRH